MIIDISVTIPAYNEQDQIEPTVREALAVLARTPGNHEIVVVDDGSKDGTWDVLQGLAARHPQLHLVRHDVNRGLPAAMQTLARTARGRYVMLIGADGQCRMSEIPRLLAALERGHDLAIGVRRDKKYTPYRKLVSFAYNALVALLWGRHFGDLGSIVMAKSSLWRQIPTHSDSAFAQAERILIAYRNGARIAQVPVEHHLRRSGVSSFSSPMSAVRALRDMLRFWLSPHSRHRLSEFHHQTSLLNPLGGLA